jgi:hypothetical protein
MGPVEVQGEATVKNDLRVTVEPSPLFDARVERIVDQKMARMPIRSTSGRDQPAGSQLRAMPGLQGGR